MNLPTRVTVRDAKRDKSFMLLSRLILKICNFDAIPPLCYKNPE